MNLHTIIQGPTTFAEKVIDHYKDIQNVCWVTNDFSSLKKNELIEKSNIKLLTYSGVNPGYGNINYQIVSSSTGIKHAMKEGADYILKIRSDLIFKNPSEVLKVVNTNDRIQCYFFVSFLDDPSFQLNTEHKVNLSKFLRKSGLGPKVKNTNKGSYVCDYLNFGPAKEMDSYWSVPLDSIIV